MFIDPQGNMYFGSTNNISYGGQADGVFMIPNEGTPSNPNLVWADTEMVSPVDGGYPPLVDKRGFLWIATSYYNNWAPAGVNGPNVRYHDPTGRNGHLFVVHHCAVEARRSRPGEFCGGWAGHCADYGLLGIGRRRNDDADRE